MKKSKKKVLITGVSGLVGRNLTPYLIKKGFRIVGCSKSKFDHSVFGSEDFLYEKINLCSQKETAALFRKHNFDLIIHLAGLIKTGFSYYDGITELFSNNVIATYNLLSNAININKAAKFIYTSSMTVYGIPEYLPVDEFHPTNPLDFYSTTKLMSEKMIHFLSMNSKLNYFILRLPGIFSSTRRSGTLFNFVEDALSNRNITIKLNRKIPWDIICIDDVIEVISACIYNKSAENVIINIDYGTKIEFRIIAEKIKKLTNSKSNIINDFPFNETPFYFDNKNAKQILNLKLPSLDYRLKEYVNYFKNV